jgi:signal transduction histidine kinase
VLLLEDRKEDARMIFEELRRAGFAPVGERVESEVEFLAHLDPTLDIILADYHQPQFDALRALQLVQENVREVPVIVLTGSLGEEAEVECLKRGACDYLLKDRLARLGRAVGQCLDRKQAREEYAERLEALSRQLIRAQEDERQRIARELHDEVGQCLTAVKLSLDQIACEPPGSDISDRVADAAAITGLAIEQVRDLSRLLRPAILDDLGLTVALRSLVRGLSERAGLGAKVEIDEVGPVNPDVEIACYRIVQEALNNTVKHARATKLRVALNRAADELELVVEDNGSGFDVTSATARAARGWSLGMLGMRERAVLAGGWAEISSRPGLGTRIRAVIPAVATLAVAT